MKKTFTLIGLCLGLSAFASSSKQDSVQHQMQAKLDQVQKQVIELQQQVKTMEKQQADQQQQLKTILQNSNFAAPKQLVIDRRGSKQARLQ